LALPPQALILQSGTDPLGVLPGVNPFDCFQPWREGADPTFSNSLDDFTPDRPTQDLPPSLVEDADCGLPPMRIQANIPHGKPPFVLRELSPISPRRLTERGLAS
jgi:hypothetical protein